MLESLGLLLFCSASNLAKACDSCERSVGCSPAHVYALTLSPCE